MLLCTKNLGCNKPDGHRSPCENRTVKITPELVTISYRRDGKTYLASMPSEHAEWAEEMLSLDRAEVERKAAQKGWDQGFDAGWAECSDPGAFVNDLWDAKTPNPYGLTAEQEGENDGDRA